MNRELLFRFFENNTSIQEEKLIRHWVEQSEENHQFLLSERLAYNIMLLAGSADSVKKITVTKFSPWKWGIAASILILISIGSIFYFNKPTNSVKYSTIIVPPGQIVNVILADSTRVWLNANTSLKYPTEFLEKNRMVYLDGEAFFDVSKNKEKPFIVKTKVGDILVTGTRFNIDAFAKDNTFETSLFEGGVELYQNDQKIASLKPNQKSTFIDGKIIISTIDGEDDYLWRDGIFAFKDKNLAEILPSLSKSFNVKISIQSKNLSSNTFSGKFKLNDGVDYALQTLQRSVKFTYQKDEKTGNIYIK
ncbi:FecR family protein [Pedobacter cryotolerans]|uniref:FecR family protein n=1 Tax=Pedobacter cryotolerans TaxID=2571270 RepID=A0A4U1BXT5_9SPHI|nr:FecR family protein [Pedobacter cryotolerans]TKB97201.1 FecR family protein [Pedobacter cryotolerans]